MRSHRARTPRLDCRPCSGACDVLVRSDGRPSTSRPGDAFVRSVHPEREEAEASPEGLRHAGPVFGRRHRSVLEVGHRRRPGEPEHEIERLRLLEHAAEIEALPEAPMGNELLTVEDRFGLIEHLIPGGNALGVNL